LLGFGFGLASAYYWWKSSRVTPDPDRPDGIGPVDPELAQLDWTVAFNTFAQQSGALNRKAAILTAIAVVLTSASSVVSLLS